MARRHPRKATAVDELTDEIRNRQGNVIWPGPLVNGMLVDRLAWKGSPGATALQRVRLIIFGLSFSLVGLVSLSIAKGVRSLWLGAFAMLWLLLGARVLYNAFRGWKIGGPRS
jgi:hypothetical protein